MNIDPKIYLNNLAMAAGFMVALDLVLLSRPDSWDLLFQAVMVIAFGLHRSSKDGGSR